jgi:hypothetical protein
MAKSATEIVGKCKGAVRHWWSVYGLVGLKSPICSHCYAINPFFTAEDAVEYDANRRYANSMNAADLIEWATAKRIELGWDAQPKDDLGCPLCGAQPDEMCVTPDGKARNDHKAREYVRLC